MRIILCTLCLLAVSSAPAHASLILTTDPMSSDFLHVTLAYADGVAPATSVRAATVGPIEYRLILIEANEFWLADAMPIFDLYLDYETTQHDFTSIIAAGTQEVDLTIGPTTQFVHTFYYNGVPIEIDRFAVPEPVAIVIAGGLVALLLRRRSR